MPPAPSFACATGAAIEYAVIHLEVSHVVICGHTECGGIKALEASPEPERQPHITSWLELARPARERVLEAGFHKQSHYIETIKANILLQCENLRSYPCVVERELSGDLSIHAWLYDLHTGRILAHDAQSGSWGAVSAPPTPES